MAKIEFKMHKPQYGYHGYDYQLVVAGVRILNIAVRRGMGIKDVDNQPLWFVLVNGVDDKKRYMTDKDALAVAEMRAEEIIDALKTKVASL